MKKVLVFAAISALFFLASCKTIVAAPEMVQRTPDTLRKPTETVLLHDTISELPRGTEVITSEDQKVTVVLKQDTKVEIRDGNIIDAIRGKQDKEIVLPKNTEVYLPEDTIVKTIEGVEIVLEAGTKTVLPVGTEIEVSKINWYALLFYAILIGGAVFAFFKVRNSETVVSVGGVVKEDDVSTTTPAPTTTPPAPTTTPKATTTPKPTTTEAPEISSDKKQPGDVWAVPESGRWGGKNKNGDIRYYINESGAREFAAN